jgi:predicted ATPase
MYDELAEQEPERLDEIETRPATEEEVREFFESPTRGERLVRKLAQSSPDQLKDLVLIDIRNDTPVSHRDVGIGISQVLPVLVYSYANQEKTIAIEQPEIHLHPALQAELGDVFIESALGERKNTFLLETHSEHLILRIMRRIRETTAGTLPQGLTPIKPDDVAVLYVEPDGSRSIIREMELNANGEFVKSWPGGFFEEGLREIFA